MLYACMVQSASQHRGIGVVNRVAVVTGGASGVGRGVCEHLARAGASVHGHSVNAGASYAELANATHAMSSASHLHNVTTHTCQIDGDVAYAESYVMVVLLSPDERTTSIMNGRYVDRLEKRDGHWRIAVRRATVDAVVTGDASMLHHPFFTQQGYIRGTRDHTDISYQRPVSLDGPEPVRW